MNTSSDCREFCCCGTYEAVGIKTPCPICRLVEKEEKLNKEYDELLISYGNVVLANARLKVELGETNEALAACQSQAGGEISRLKQYEDAVNRISATGYTISEAVELLESHAEDDDPCSDCGMRPTFDGMWHKQGCQYLATSAQSVVTTTQSDNEREVERMIKDHTSIIANKGKACVFCGAIGGEHHLSTCRAEGDKSDGATSTVPDGRNV